MIRDNKQACFILPLVLALLTGLSNNGFAQQETEYLVAKDGSGDFTNIQAAIDDSKSYPYERITIFIKNGVYKEKVKVHSWNPNISLIGESKEKTIITYDDYFDKVDRGRNSTFHTYTLLVDGNDFHAENLTIKNSAGPVGQAVALHVEADRVSFENCRFLGNQDTIYLAGEGARHYFNNCYIDGTTDFIFGSSTAVFEDCTLHSKKNSFITAASTPQSESFGFVFLDSKLTAEANVDSVYLGRPWRKYAQTVFINTYMGDHIVPEGWDNWGDESNEETVFYAEYNSQGAGAFLDERVDWSEILSEDQAQKYILNNIFGDWEPNLRK
ncbi:pectinesterase family protein [Aliifodinibius salicampi]|uniref:Pectinesterase n=1 Tax=Fodinibius salicampi TaxID=1920655 RepID=A0ABT3PUI5_9BACT|nr:pectinesterase family protein [Fodinibius salicampi]MCW9711505.1 pectinesterase family protein [Fodinibius salicampi]